MLAESKGRKNADLAAGVMTLHIDVYKRQSRSFICASKRFIWSIGSFSSEYALPYSPPIINSSNLSVSAGPVSYTHLSFVRVKSLFLPAIG